MIMSNKSEKMGKNTYTHIQICEATVCENEESEV
jgi:hypothetical protein